MATKDKELLNSDFRGRLKATRDALEKAIAPVRKEHAEIVSMRSESERLTAEVLEFQDRGNLNDGLALQATANKQSKANLQNRRIEQAEDRLNGAISAVKAALPGVDELHRTARLEFAKPHVQRLAETLAEFHFDF